MNFDAKTVFFVLFAAVVGFMLFRVMKHGGFKAAMFGASIESTVGKVRGGSSKLIKMPITVHRLGGSDPEKAVGLEIVAKSFGSYEMMPVSLSVSETKNLIGMLQAAVSDK